MRFLPGGDRDDYDDGGWRISIVLRISCRVMSPPGALRLVFTYVCTPTTLAAHTPFTHARLTRGSVRSLGVFRTPSCCIIITIVKSQIWTVK